jgi:hypothetical protein
MGKATITANSVTTVETATVRMMISRFAGEKSSA